MLFALASIVGWRRESERYNEVGLMLMIIQALELIAFKILCTCLVNLKTYLEEETAERTLWCHGMN